MTRRRRPKLDLRNCHILFLICLSDRLPAMVVRLHIFIIFFFIFFSHFYFLSSLWTSRCHRWRPFPPPVLAFNFYRAQGSAIPLLVDCSSSVCLLTLSRFPQVNLGTRKSPNEFTRVRTRRGSNSRNWPIPGSRITCCCCCATGATGV